MVLIATKLVALLKPKRTWLQFRLKTIFVLVVIVAVPCGWLKWNMEAKRRERTAIAEIERLGGDVRYNWKIARNKKSPGAKWFHKLLGDYFFSRVVEVELDTPSVSASTDEWLVHLEPLTELSTIYLNSNLSTDAGVQYVTRFKKLNDLGLSGSGVTDASLLYLYGCPTLRRLRLESTNVSDAAVAELQRALPDCDIRIIR